MSNYVEVVRAKPPRGKGKIATIEIHPNQDGYNAIVNYEDGSEPEIRECKSRGVLVGYLMKILPNNARPEPEPEQ